MRDEAQRAAGERAAMRIRAVAAPVRAPQSLRSAVAADRLASLPSPRRARTRSVLGAGLAAVVAAALAALVLAGDPHTPEAGSVADAAQAALRPPTAPPPARSASGGLALRVGGVAFPGGAAGEGWRPVGTRTDTIGGRRAVTVTYARGAARIGYTIVDGAPLPVPAGARRVRYEGIDVAVLERGATRFITWTRGGRTCVLATRGAPLARLLDVAAS